MPRVKKEETVTENIEVSDKVIPSIHDIGWTDYVLNLLTEDEKIMGNPTTDGLRRIFEIAINGKIISSVSKVVQTPSRENDMRATVCHSLTFVLNDTSTDTQSFNYTVDGSADVYWGNCDKVFRNHPVAVAETRAEGRALRRALRLRKVVAAEELAENIEDHPDANTIDKITNNQINFIDVIAKRLNINVLKMIEHLDIKQTNIYNISYDDAVRIASTLSEYQQKNSIPDNIIGYESSWK
jgi:hypothetical protein